MMQVTWNQIGQAEWDALYAKAQRPAFQQSFAYGEAVRVLGSDVQRAVVTDGDKIIAIAQVNCRKLFRFFHASALLKGPLLFDEAYDYTDVVSAIIQSAKFKRKRRTLFASQHELNAPYKRIMSGESTAYWNLKLSAGVRRKALHQKWRNALVRAEKSELEIKRGGQQLEHYEWLLQCENEKREERSYSGLPVGFIPLFAEVSLEKRPVLSLAAYHNNERVAGMLFLVHPPFATYMIGWSNDKGRELNAQHLLLWEASEVLAKRGILSLDLGGIDTVNAPGIARFKLGINADIVTSPGTYMKGF